MPITATLAMVAAGAMAGVPLANGFLSKEMFFAETVGRPAFDEVGWLLPLFVTLAGILAVAYSARFIHDVFFNGAPIDLPKTAARAAALDARADRGAGGWPACWSASSRSGRVAPLLAGGGRGAAGAAAGIPAGALARLQPGPSP
jgi:hypothetical protein